MSYGIPSVVSALIASQLNLDDGKEVFIADNPDEFARKIILLYQNEQVWEDIHNRSVEYICETCDPEQKKDELRRSLNVITTE
jgi:glycosyltransferase involved in cell wall biosynthesis